MWRKRIFWVFALLLILLAGCTNGGPADKAGTDQANGVNETSDHDAADLIKVTTTIAQIADAVKHIGGERVMVSSLMGPGVDPHLYQATQGDIKKLAEADIIFYNGLQLEGKMNEILETISREKPTYALGERVPTDLLKADEDNPDQYDPHIWFDIPLWKEALKQITEALIQLDPEHEAVYREHEVSYFQELDELHQYALEQIETIPEESRVLITAHDAFGYFGEAYGLEVMGLQGLSTEAEYGLRDVQELIELVISRDIKAVFIESSISERSIQAVIEGAKERGHDLVIGGELFSDAMGEEGTPEGTYVGMFKHNIDTIVGSLK